MCLKVESDPALPVVVQFVLGLGQEDKRRECFVFEQSTVGE